MKKLMLTAMVMLAVAAVANAALVPIVDVTGFSGGDSYTAGDFTPLTNGVGTANPDPADPSTWTNSGTSYKDEWYDHHLVAAANGKLGWVSLDLGDSKTDLDSLYLWNCLYGNGGTGTETFNIYYADTPTVDLPTPPGQNKAIDYDFASGGWTQLGSTQSLGLKASGVYDISAIPSARYIALEIMTSQPNDTRSGFREAAITAVPEPATLAILALGGLFLRRRRA